jgi:hypothetical protein
MSNKLLLVDNKIIGTHEPPTSTRTLLSVENTKGMVNDLRFQDINTRVTANSTTWFRAHNIRGGQSGHAKKGYFVGVGVTFIRVAFDLGVRGRELKFVLCVGNGHHFNLVSWTFDSETAVSTLESFYCFQSLVSIVIIPELGSV